jgi:hypothetical protein
METLDEPYACVRISGTEYLSEGPLVVLKQSDCRGVYPEHGLLYEVLHDGERTFAAIRLFKPEDITVCRPHRLDQSPGSHNCCRPDKG